MSNPTSTLPTIILIHEAWHAPVFYSRLVDLLHTAGFKIACPHLPTCSSESNNAATFADDASLLYSLTFDLASEGHDILILMHGIYGGILGTDIAGPLCKSQRAATGRPGGVVGLVYLAAAMPDTGQSWIDIMSACAPAAQSAIPPAPAQADGTAALLAADTFLFAADDGALETAHWCSHLARWSARVADVRVDAAEPAWAVCRSTYVVCASDRLLSEGVQRAMVDAARSKRALVDVEVLHHAGHEAQIREPEGVVAAMIAAASKARGAAGRAGFAVRSDVLEEAEGCVQPRRLARSATVHV